MKYLITPSIILPIVGGGIGYSYGYIHNVQMQRHQQYTKKEFSILYGIIGTLFGTGIGIVYDILFTFRT